ncbi:hypothetical protein NCHU2750_21010 [Neorhizobium sp. NCHU2750]|nr:hypothetical protein NCHU2750_21010 [Neorhizobium sp. NCHU2750]
MALAALAACSGPPALAQQFGLMQACRGDFQAHCSGVAPGGGRIIECMRQHASELSAGCRAAIASQETKMMTKMAAKAEGGDAHVPAGVTVRRNIAYGTAPAQLMDIYAPQKPAHAPIIVMVHGGAWAFGSKTSAGVVENKVAHWLPQGFIFVSVETRLLPKADPVQQAGDVAAALASVERNAASWGGDPSKIVLMGHSAGAHLVALVTTDHALGQKVGLRPWAGTVALDSAAYDIIKIMQQPGHPPFYDKVFGKDPRFWAEASPALQLKGPVLPMLLVCSSLRSDSCPQAKAFAAKTGGKAQVLPVALKHMQIDSELGAGNDYTQQVDAFLRSIGLP